MKSILLASASIVAFAGAAAAEVSFSGSAELGYNDTDTVSDADDDLGFFWSADLAVTLTQALDNGLTASATFGLDIVDGNLGGDVTSNDYVLSLTSETAGLYYGTTDFAANKHWVAAGDMGSDGFTSDIDDDAVIRGDVMFGGVNASVSYIVDNANDELAQLSVGASGAFGNFTFAVGFQEESDYVNGNGDYNGDGIFGVSVGTSFGGADVRVAYAQNSTADTDSIGVSASYPVGPVTLGAYYVMESTDNNQYGISAEYASGPITAKVNFESGDNDEEDWSIEGSYDVGNGITAFAGVSDAGEDFYVAGSLAIAEGASLLVSYAEDGDDDAEDEIGANDYKDGATVAVSFSF